jgi:hypothetical protein
VASLPPLIAKDVQDFIKNYFSFNEHDLSLLSEVDLDQGYALLKTMESYFPTTNSNGKFKELNQDKTILRTRQHAARIFTDSQMRLSPKYGFLFYVEFDFNPLISLVSNTSAREMGMIVKSVGLPKYTIDTKTHNAYNRKNIVQNRIQYDPVNIIFHDDQSDTVTNFWYDYYSYFYRDPDYADATYNAPHKYQSRASFDWGYTPRPAIGYNNSLGPQPYQYIQAIRIYSLYQQNFSEYELINPVITSFKHGEHANGSNNNLLEHQMAVTFETVKYQTGYVTNNTVGGFIDLHYDTVPSPNPYPTDPTVRNDTVTDAATLSTAINPNLRSEPSFNGGGFGSIFGTAIGASSIGVGINNGGFSIPTLGSLSSGVPSISQIRQQATATGIGLVGSSASTLANGLVGGVSSALGPQGKSIIGLAAATIANPNAVLKQGLNYATSYATAIASNYVNDLVGQASGELSKMAGEYVKDGLGYLNKEVGTLVFGDTFGGGTLLTEGLQFNLLTFENPFSFNIGDGLVGDIGNLGVDFASSLSDFGASSIGDFASGIF